MPDHIHLFCAPQRHPIGSLKSWIGFWRAEVTRHWPNASEKPIWQKDFFDRQLRTGESYRKKCEYVRQNPVRAGLVTNAESYPWQGEVSRLIWNP